MSANKTQARILAARLFGAVVVGTLLITEPRYGQVLTGAILELIGLMLISVAAIGRVWTSSYLASYKDTELIRTGPFSISRNPLYGFTLIGVVGIGVATSSIVILVVTVIFVSISHGIAIRQEEAKLAAIFGDEFQQYLGAVPRICPNLKLYESPPVISVHSKIYRKAFVDALGWLSVYPGLRIIDILHDHDILPVIAVLP